MECRRRKRKGSRESGVKVRGVGSVAEGKWSGGNMSERKQSGGSWKNGSEDIIKVRKAKGSVGGRKIQNWKGQKSEASVL